MIKTIKILLLGMIIAMTFSSTVSAGWTNAKNVEWLYVQWKNGMPYMEISTGSDWGEGCSEQEVSRNDDDAVQQQLLSIALAAFLSGKKIKVFLNNNCVIQRIMILDQ